MTAQEPSRQIQIRRGRSNDLMATNMQKKNETNVQLLLNRQVALDAERSLMISDDEENFEMKQKLPIFRRWDEVLSYTRCKPEKSEKMNF